MAPSSLRATPGSQKKQGGNPDRVSPLVAQPIRDAGGLLNRRHLNHFTPPLAGLTWQARVLLRCIDVALGGRLCRATVQRVAHVPPRGEMGPVEPSLLQGRLRAR